MAWLFDPCATDPTDNLNDCQCGKCAWEARGHGEDTEYYCRKCGTGPAVETLRRVTTQVAHKMYPKSHVGKGDTYRRIVIGGYYPNGSRWLNVHRTLVTRACPLI